MPPALPLLHDESFLEEHRRIHQRLLRMQKFSAPESGFPTALSALVACMDEIEGLLPDLTEHFSREERVFRYTSPSETASDEMERAEQVMAEHQPLIREMRALLDSGRRVIEDLRAGLEASSMAEALKAYLSACVQDLLDHEDKEKLLLTWEPGAGNSF